MEGFVVLYTNLIGLETYLSTGSCMACIKKEEDYQYQIVVPYKSVETFPEDQSIAYQMKKIVKVKVVK